MLLLKVSTQKAIYEVTVLVMFASEVACCTISSTVISYKDSWQFPFAVNTERPCYVSVNRLEPSTEHWDMNFVNKSCGNLPHEWYSADVRCYAKACFFL
jgi:hypothetical protein